MKYSPIELSFFCQAQKARIEPDPNSKDHVFIVDEGSGEVITRAKAKNGKPVKGIFVAERPIFLN